MAMGISVVTAHESRCTSLIAHRQKRVTSLLTTTRSATSPGGIVMSSLIAFAAGLLFVYASNWIWTRCGSIAPWADVVRFCSARRLRVADQPA